MSGALISACTDRVGTELVPRYLTERDHGWLARVLEEHEAHVGRRKLELDRRLEDLAVQSRVRSKLHLVLRVLDRLERTQPLAALSPKEARAITFRAASSSFAPRARILAEIAAGLGLPSSDLEAALFADLKSERRVQPLGTPSPAALAAEANVALATSLVARAALVRIHAWGDTTPLVKHARRSGLIGVARPGPDGALDLEVSGPAALFDKTMIYARALGSLLPRLGACDRFELRATITLPRSDEACTLVLRSGDLGTAPRELASHETKLEARFGHDLRRHTTDWELSTDPSPIEAAGILIFPDFELRHRVDLERSWLIEIVGFWTPSYLATKLERLELAGVRNLVLCVDAKKSCAAGELPEDPRIVPYASRIDAKKIAALIDAQSSVGTGAPATPTATS